MHGAVPPPEQLHYHFLCLQGILHLIALCIREVMRQYNTSRDYKFTLLMEWLSEMCDDMAFFD
jgi:hypothetical protein